MVLAAIAGIYKSICGICETERLDSALWSVEGETLMVKVGEVPQLAEKDGAVYVQGEGLATPVLVVKTGDGEFAAFENRCTHLPHRKLDPVPGEDRLRCCSISHSRFDMEGKPVSGPGTEPIMRYETALSDGNLTIAL